MLEQRQLLSAAPAALLSLDHGVGFSLAYVTARGGKSATHGHGRSRTAAAPTTTSQPTSDLTFTPFDDPTFSDADIGSPAVAGSASYSSGTYTVSGAGTDIWGTSDQFNFASQSFTGDGSIVAEINSQTNTNSAAKAGVMIRNDSTAGSAYAAAFVTPGQGVDFQWRSAAGGNTSDTLISGVTAPVWLKLTRSGDSFTAYYSTDGSTWTQIGSAETAAVSSNALAGLAVGSKNTATLSTATFTNLSFAAAPALPSGWSDGDIGSPADVGGATFDGTIWTVAGGGTDIWSTADQFNFASQSLTGDGSIVADVTSQTNTNSGAKAGVMIRNDSTAGSAYAAAFITPSQGVDFQWRSTAGGTTSDTLISGITAPVWLKLARSGDSFTAYYSTDGSTWTQIGSAETANVASSALAGLAVGSKNTATLSTATFTNLSLTAAPSLPSGWTDGDIGSPADVGGATFDGTTWTIAGGGTDIWSTADQFNFASQSFTGDGSIVAEVTSQTNTNSAAKAGVMIRNDSTAGSAYAAAFITPGQGVDFQWRSTAGGATADTLIAGITAPAWVKLTRIGQSFAAYYSTDGSTWTQIGSVQSADVASSALAGLAVGSKNAATLSTATFTNLSLTAAPPLPSGWSDTDIGTATPPGYAGYDGTTVTIASTGVIGPNTFNSMYIGGTTDSFNTVYQPLGSNQQFAAEITSQEDASALAKAGIMLRASTDPSDVFAGLFVTPGWGVALLDRTASGTDATSSGFDNSYSLKNGPLWVKLTTSGGIVTGFVSADGTNWSQIGQVTIDLGSSPLAGLAVDGGDGQSRGTASFTNFSLGTITTSTTIPEAPYDTYAEAYSGTDGRLVWEPMSGVDTFTIEQSTDGGNTYKTVATVPGSADTYLPNDLSPDTTYTYRVQATAGGVNSLNSATASLTTTANDTAGSYSLFAGTPQVLYNYFGDTMAVTLATTATSASSWQQAYFLDASGSVSSPGLGLNFSVGNFAPTSSGTGFYGNSFGLVGTSDSSMGFNADAGTFASTDYNQVDVLSPVGIDGYLGEIESDNTTELPRDQAEGTGGYVMLNDDNDNYQFTNSDGTGDPIPDLDKTNVVGEHDLLQLKLHKVSDASVGGYYFLSCTSGLELWNQETMATQVTTTQSFSATTDSTVYVEGVGLSSAAAADSVTLYWSQNQDGSGKQQIDNVKYTVWSMAGPEDVPAYGTYQYSVDVPGQDTTGQPQQTQNWHVDDGTFTSFASSAPDATVQWDGGPDVGKVFYTPDGMGLFYGEWDVNVVGVQVSVPAGESGAVNPGGIYAKLVIAPNNALSLDINTDGAIDAASHMIAGEFTYAQVTLSGPNGNRGVSRIQAGLIQDVTYSYVDGFYANGKELVSSTDALFNSSPIFDGPPTNGPWYTGSAQGFADINTHALYPAVPFNDSPFQEIPIDYQQTNVFNAATDSPLTYAYLSLGFQDSVCAVTLDAPQGEDYVREATANWSVDGGGVVGVSGTGNNTGAGIVFNTQPNPMLPAPVYGDTTWTTVTDGSQPVTSGPTATQLGQNNQFH